MLLVIARSGSDWCAAVWQAWESPSAYVSRETARLGVLDLHYAESNTNAPELLRAAESIATWRIAVHSCRAARELTADPCSPVTKLVARHP